MKIARPKCVAGSEVQTEKMAFRAQCVDASITYDWRGTRANGVVPNGGVWTVVFMGPKDLAIGLPKTDDPFLRAMKLTRLSPGLSQGCIAWLSPCDVAGDADVEADCVIARWLWAGSELA